MLAGLECLDVCVRTLNLHNFNKIELRHCINEILHGRTCNSECALKATHGALQQPGPLPYCLSKRSRTFRLGSLFSPPFPPPPSGRHLGTVPDETVVTRIWMIYIPRYAHFLDMSKYLGRGNLVLTMSGQYWHLWLIIDDILRRLTVLP